MLDHCVAHAKGWVALGAWEKQTRELLDQLVAERQDLADHLARVDERIEHIRLALGRGSARRPAGKSRPARGRKGGVSARVLKALQEKTDLNITALTQMTGLDEKQVRASIGNLRQAGKVTSKSRGLYRLA